MLQATPTPLEVHRSLPGYHIIAMYRQLLCALLIVSSTLGFAPTPTTRIHSTSSSSQLSGLPDLVASSNLLVSAVEDYEVAELPPPIVPVVFGIGLLVGVGLLTGSLGDVMDEEAQLGMQSGARAKKEIERSRSSYFKK